MIKFYFSDILFANSPFLFSHQFHIYLRSRYVPMSQHLADSLNICSGSNLNGCKAVSKAMENDMFMFHMLIVGNHQLFSDAEMLKYIPQHHIIRNLSCYITQMEDALADILRYKIAR